MNLVRVWSLCCILQDLGDAEFTLYFIASNSQNYVKIARHP